MVLLNLGKNANTYTAGRISYPLSFSRILMINKLNTKLTKGAYVLCKIFTPILVIVCQRKDLVWPAGFLQLSLPNRFEKYCQIDGKKVREWYPGVLVYSVQMNKC